MSTKCVESRLNMRPANSKVILGDLVRRAAVRAFEHEVRDLPNHDTLRNHTITPRADVIGVSMTANERFIRRSGNHRTSFHDPRRSVTHFDLTHSILAEKRWHC